MSMQKSPHFPPARVLGERIERAWSSANRSLASFKEIAAIAIADTDLSLFATSEVAHWVAGLERSLPQLNPGIPFGDPAVTVWYGDGFVIDLYYWNQYASGVHDHKFSGAFTVIEGLTVEYRYGFEVTEAVTDRVLVGKLYETERQLLGPGEISLITAGSSLIHHPGHLELPTVTLCVRTINEQEIDLQYTYFSPGLALAISQVEQAGHRLSFMSALRHRPAACIAYLERLIETTSLVVGVQAILNYASEHRDLAGCRQLIERVPSSSAALRQMIHDVVSECCDEAYTRAADGDTSVDALLSDLALHPDGSDIVRHLTGFLMGAPSSTS